LSTLRSARRVAVVTKLRYMGDTIVATPLLRHLRCYLPTASITLLTAPSVAVALKNCPYVDSLVSMNSDGKSRFQQALELGRALRAGRFTAVFLVNRSFHCALMALLARVPIRIGARCELRGPLLTVGVPRSFYRHEVDGHLDILRTLGYEVKAALPELWLQDEERAAAADVLRAHGWDDKSGRPLIAFQPGANDAWIRAWGAERYAFVADTLLGETGGVGLMLGGPGERGAAAAMAKAARSPLIDLVGEIELRQALAVIGLVDLWIGNDTGLLHAAVAQHVPSVGLFGPNKVARWGYDAPRHRSLVVFPESPAHRDSDVRRCLDAISENQVLEAAHDVLRAASLPSASEGNVLYRVSEERLRSVAAVRRR
jgi:heptosyltransferase-2